MLPERGRPEDVSLSCHLAGHIAYSSAHLCLVEQCHLLASLLSAGQFHLNLSIYLSKKKKNLIYSDMAYIYTSNANIHTNKSNDSKSHTANFMRGKEKPN